MKVCIAEKPSVAREIASILGANARKDGYFEGNGYQVTWTFGHFCTLKEPHEYTQEWKKWSLFVLPMIPPRFGIKIIDNDGIKKQFSVIETLISQAAEVINCGDAGQEGELIQRWVLQKAQCKVPVKRLWISSLTEDSIREGFNNLKEEQVFDKLYEAGLSRAIGDWLLGMNATRLYTVKYGQNRSVLSIGRVQTPTLALIVNRQLEIENFKPEPYWELKTVYRETTFSATKGRFLVKEEGEKFLEEIKQADFEVTDVSVKKGEEAPPRLFDLTALQVECNKKYAFSAEDTLKTIQSLYEKKLVTYPRVDTTFLSDDIYPKIPAILRGISGYEELVKPLLAAAKIPKSKKVFDNSKVTDHHAIIPTGVRANAIAGNEQKVYDLITRRFISAFYPNCKIATTTVLGEVNKIEFKVTGKQILEPGWRVVFEKQAESQDEKEEDADDNILPAFEKGESGPHIPALNEKWTQPPKYYTEATLLRAMETAGKLVDDDELRDALKENGIGRPSTRAAIIETLFKRNYIRKERKNLYATQTGVELIGTIKEELLKSAELTGIWEKKLRQIERNEYDPRQFIDELKQMLIEIVANVKNDWGTTITIQEAVKEEAKSTKKPTKEKKASDKKTTPKPKKEKKTESKNSEPLSCPLCKVGKILKGKTAYGCSEWKQGCTFRLTFDEVGDSLTDDELKAIFETKYKS
ncbi:MAG: DNA topoisomerase 3 [Dysgonomonas mossii]|uniref:DNA topoisomerase 3 n=1 Tax=Dysgonomonas mossii TaxID=163665 RepID=UPI001D8A6422|nr:DNA topoisomerase 3 [Dysgonomonas mossii]MBS5797806.1 DNA topoisomerase 3 [Dysgonomonas mossii]MBS7112425.1 DNA topoisomerase 3 [Dysgonomonas mossii]